MSTIVRCDTCGRMGHWPDSEWVRTHVGRTDGGAFPLHFCCWQHVISYAEKQARKANPADPEKTKAAIDGR